MSNTCTLGSWSLLASTQFTPGAVMSLVYSKPTSVPRNTFLSSSFSISEQYTVLPTRSVEPLSLVTQVWLVTSALRTSTVFIYVVPVLVPVVMAPLRVTSSFEPSLLTARLVMGLLKLAIWVVRYGESRLGMAWLTADTYLKTSVV